ncbi:hypothetical protein [Weissella viridescens]|uniref:hypothetical protein n=1 Tax=Weissella viridescens TaxID=1629 RepID=UPI003AF2D152
MPKIKKFHLPTAAQIEFFIEDKTIARQRFYLLAYGILMACLLFGAWTGRRTEPIDVSDTKIGTSQPVGDGNTQVKLTDSRYNPAKNLLEMDFQATGTSNSSNSFTFTGKELKFDGHTNHGSAKLESIPTVDNHWTVVISNLDKNFGSVEVRAMSNMPNVGELVTDGGESENSKPTFAATQKHIKHDRHLTLYAPDQLALKTVDQQISNAQKSVQKNTEKLKQTEAAIDFKNQQIDDLKENIKQMTSNEADNASDTIGDLREQITTEQDNVTQLKSDIKAKQKNIEQLEDKKQAIQSGSYRVSDETRSTTIKPKNQT